MNGVFALAFLRLRQGIGWIGLGLPVALLVLGLVFEGRVRGSISDYYHGGLRNVLVGGLCAIGVFLIAYYTPADPGTRRLDDGVSTLAGVLAFAVALCPAVPITGPPVEPPWVGVVHTVSAALFLLALAYFCYFRFPLPDPGTVDGSAGKEGRNRLYRTCGVVIAAAVVVSWVDGLIDGDSGRLFWWETIAVLAFGFAWLVKGHVLRRLWSDAARAPAAA